MAFDFLKKVFSFGPKAEEQPQEPAQPPEVPAEPTPEAPPAPEPQPTPAPAPEIPAPEQPAPAPETPTAPPEIPTPQPEVPVTPPPEIPQTPVEVPPTPAPEIPDTAPAQPSYPPTDLPPAEVQPPLRQPPTVMSDPIAGEIAPEPAPIPPAPIPAAEPRFAGRVSVGRSVERQGEVASVAPTAAPTGWLQRMRAGLQRSSRELSGNLSGVFTKGRLTEEIVEELEEVLIRADLGADTALRISDALASGRYGFQTTEAQVRQVMADEMVRVLDPVAKPLELDMSHRPHVILVVGVNGTGKTTTIGKLAAKLTAGGLTVMLAAGDTFRAAAIEQLKIWGERTGAPVVSTRLGADAAGLAFEAFEKAREAGSDVLIIDTAGRLQNKAELMAELEKVVRVLKKLDPDAPHTVLQTLDATTGQNALNQVEIFRNVAGVNGLVMTKLDGTARGGILVNIASRHKLPVYFIGVGEGVDDLEPFKARDFARAIAGSLA
ncbi:MAG: signal recognition particle-docking protein FtsY [Methylobacterium mesophilicum]|nr:signal recognition particle-docking protein FtsY [Methylobacterium mesophilicum]